MLYQERKQFTFVSKGLPEDTLTVVRFTGTEAISRPYEFDITLSSEDPDLDLKALLQNPATLTILRGDEEFHIHGLPTRFDQLHELKNRAFYRAILAPRLWQAGLYRENQLFLDKTVPQVVEEILKQSGLKGQDYEFKLTRSYPSWEYICQYQETDLNFISRWMEREGIYYFFEQTDQCEKLIVTDSLSAHQAIKGEKTLFYSPPSGLVPAEQEVVKAFVCRQRILPKKVIVKDYNYRKPSLDLKAEAEVDPKGRGEIYFYGEHFKDSGEGKDLAKVRAEELLCRETVFHGEGTAPTLAPGFLFELAEHFRNSYNQRYLVTEVEHRGTQTGLLLAGLEEGQTESEKEPGYSNRFTCIPADVQFRPERTSAKPRIIGTMNAVIDAAGGGEHAEIDDQGRYKVILPLDLSGRSGGKASRYVRMAQPYSGPDYGMHFPLHKGAEVLLTFVDGDPDRPIISGSVPNPQTTSPVTSTNQTKSIVRDNFGNEIVFDATPGKEHIWLHSPHHQSGLAIGKSVKWTSLSDSESVICGCRNDITVGFKGETVAGFKSDAVAGTACSLKMAAAFEGAVGATTSVTWDRKISVAGRDDIDFAADDFYKLVNDKALLDAKERMQLVAGSNRQSVLKMTKRDIELSVQVPTPRTGLLEKSAKGLKAVLNVMMMTAMAAHTAHAVAVPLTASEDEHGAGSGEAWSTYIPLGLHAVIAAASLALAEIVGRSVDPDRIAKETDRRNMHAGITLNDNGDVILVGDNVAISRPGSARRFLKLNTRSGRFSTDCTCSMGRGGALRID